MIMIAFYSGILTLYCITQYPDGVLTGPLMLISGLVCTAALFHMWTDK